MLYFAGDKNVFPLFCKFTLESEKAIRSRIYLAAARCSMPATDFGSVFCAAQCIGAWPSSHTAIALAMAVTLYDSLHSLNIWWGIHFVMFGY
jgi:hypothetical protein